jgi:hypothetical protein
VVLADIRRIEKAIESETIRLDKDDGTSIFKWVDKIRAANSLLGFKSGACPVPPGSDLRLDTFTLMIQTPWQLEQYRAHGSNILFMDGTHNTTMYENMTLFTLIVRNKWGHGAFLLTSDKLDSKYSYDMQSRIGIPIAWMIASNGTAETIGYFISLLREHSPLIIPHWLMTDRDLAQINALKRYFPTSTILLCWWHVLHAWQQHLVISQNVELWDKLKAWVRIECLKKFEVAWLEIQRLASSAFRDYLVQYWMTDEFRAMWSAVNRKDRAIFERSDTNMLLEAYVPHFFYGIVTLSQLSHANKRKPYEKHSHIHASTRHQDSATSLKQNMSTVSAVSLSKCTRNL